MLRIRVYTNEPLCVVRATGGSTRKLPPMLPASAAYPAPTCVSCNETQVSQPRVCRSNSSSGTCKASPARIIAGIFLRERKTLNRRALRCDSKRQEAFSPPDAPPVSPLHSPARRDHYASFFSAPPIDCVACPRRYDALDFSLTSLPRLAL
jgi:hypothetical protein